MSGNLIIYGAIIGLLVLSAFFSASEISPSSVSSEDDEDEHLRFFTGDGPFATAGRKSIVQSELKGTRKWDEASMFIVQGIYVQANNELLKIFVDDPGTHLGEELSRHKIRLRAEGDMRPLEL